MMTKVANQVIDAHDDSDKSFLCKLAKVNPNIIMMSSEERAGLKDYDFALQLITKTAKLNKFPINTHDNAWLSNQYFDYTHHRLTKTAAEIAASNIKTACDKFKIEPTASVKAMAKTAQSNVCLETEKKASFEIENPLAKFAEVSKICENEINAKYAFATAQDCENGNRYFEAFEQKIPFEYRYKYASALQKCASEVGVNLKGKIEKYAGSGYNAHVDYHVASRKKLLKTANLVSSLEKVASERNNMTPVEFATLLAEFDKYAGLNRYYDSYIADPTRSVMAILNNEKMVHVKTASINKSFSQEALSKLATAKYEKISSYLGKGVADALKKDGMAVFESLPMDAKEAIGHIADGTL